MKNLIITLLCCFTLTASWAQEKYAFYNNYLDNKPYNLMVSKKGESYNIYAYMYSLDRYSDKGGLMLSESEHKNFLSAMAESKAKYSEWAATAKENKVEEIQKTMTHKAKAGGMFLYGGKWNFQFALNVSFEFKVADGEYLLIVRTGKLKSSSNQYITHDGFVFVFHNEAEIDEFTQALSVEKLQEHFAKQKPSDLFKD